MASEEYKRGFVDGWTQQYFYRGDVSRLPAKFQRFFVEDWGEPPQYMIEEAGRAGFLKPKKKKRKLSAWQKFVKTNSKMPRFKYKTGKRKGMVNMKALAAAWKRKKKR